MNNNIINMEDYKYQQVKVDAIKVLNTLLGSMDTDKVPAQPNAESQTFINLCKFRKSQVQLVRRYNQLYIHIVGQYPFEKPIGQVSRNYDNNHLSGNKAVESASFNKKSEVWVQLVRWLIAMCLPASKVKRHWA